MPRRRPTRRRTNGTSYRRRNRRIWDRTSDAYDARHHRALSASDARAWGLWRVSEEELDLLGPIRGLRVLEVGCGAARWSVALARAGARSVGIDVSSRQLEKARAITDRSERPVALVRGTVEALPFRSGTFDRVLSDWGALTFADPSYAIGEASRVLRPGGRLVFAAANPFRYVAFDRAHDRPGRRLVRPYFGVASITFDGLTEFTRTFGEWVTLFRRNRLAIEGLLETTPPPGRTSSYLGPEDESWARRWPLECLWTLRREPEDEPSARTGRRSARSSSR